MKKELLLKLNKCLEEIKKVNYQNLFRLENFKLYDIAYELENEKDYDIFNDFCFSEFNFFDEILKENGCKLIQFGRTSNNYIVGESNTISEYDRNEVLRYSNNEDYKLYIILNDFINENIDYDLSVNIENGIVTSFENKDVDDNYLKEYYNIDSILNNIDDDLKYYIKNNITDVNNVFKYVDDFKKNQIEIFRDFKENCY